MLFLKIILIIFIFFILLVTLKLEIKIKNIKYSSEKINGRNLSNDYQITIKIFTLEKIPILIIRLNKLKLEKINRQMHIKQKVEQEIAKQDFTKIIEAEKKYYLKKLIPEVYRNINLEIKDIDIKIEIGTENVILTSFIVPCISTILAFFIKRNFKVNPIYQNKNIIKFELNGIFDIKMIHIISTICILKKEKESV